MVLKEVFIKVLIAVVLSGLIGFERERRHRPAGFRTIMLVCLGSALFVLVTLETLPSEAGRIIAGIATGIGFLGAGTIFRSKSEVHGLTTAASIWAVAGVGIAIGLGYYLMTLISVVLILIILQLNKMEFFKRL